MQIFLSFFRFFIHKSYFFHPNQQSQPITHPIFIIIPFCIFRHYLSQQGCFWTISGLLVDYCRTKVFSIAVRSSFYHFCLISPSPLFSFLHYRLQNRIGLIGITALLCPMIVTMATSYFFAWDFWYIGRTRVGERNKNG